MRRASGRAPGGAPWRLAGAVGATVVTAWLTAGCASPPVAEAPTTDNPWDAARARGIDFRAVGQEPGWYLEIQYGGSMHLVFDYGEREAAVPAPKPTFDRGKTTYAATGGGNSLEAVIEPRRCHDVMSGEAFTSTVTVYINRRELRGCGRALR